MALDSQQQAIKILEKSQNILVTCNKDLDGDSIGSSFALFLLLKKLDKKVSLVFDQELPEKYKFLPEVNFTLKQYKNNSNALTISCDLGQKNIKEVYYEKQDGELKIYLSSENKALSPKDLKIEGQESNFDLIIAINSPDLETLGDIFYQNPDLFYKTPILNIDYKALNENYGEINLIELTASSCSEILTDLLKSAFIDFLDDKIFTCLLCGIVSATNNFQNNLASPKTLALASYLMEKEAAHQEIIRYLYKTKDLSNVKLFGRVLARMKEDKQKNLSYAALPREDFDLTLTSPSNLKFVLEEVRGNLTYLNPFLILWENKADQILGVLLCQQKEKMENFHAKLGGIIKNDLLFFQTEATNLSKAQEETLGKT